MGLVPSSWLEIRLAHLAMANGPTASQGELPAGQLGDDRVRITLWLLLYAKSILVSRTGGLPGAHGAILAAGCVANCTMLGSVITSSAPARRPLKRTASSDLVIFGIACSSLLGEVE